MSDLRHQRTGELEIGATDVLRRHPTVKLAADHAPPVPNWILAVERRRPRLLREMVAEAAGVFSYVYCGVSGLATFFLTNSALAAGTGPPGFGGLLNVAFGFAMGIAFAIISCASTSGGHFNPAMTLVFATYQGFPWKKVPFYIFAQIFGSFMACMIIYCQWHQQIIELEDGLKLLGQPLISATGPAGIFCAIPAPGQLNRWLFALEFFADSFIGFIIWTALDPNNPFISPATAPFVIGLAYFTMILGFGAGTLSTNLARDLGARMMAACFYGRGVFTVNNGYAAISILVNIPATFLGVTFYQFVMGDSQKLLRTGRALPKEVHSYLATERKDGNGEPGAFEQALRQDPDMRHKFLGVTNGMSNGNDFHNGKPEVNHV